MLRPSYNCTQQELYTICRLGWQSCKQHFVYSEHDDPAFRDVDPPAKQVIIERTN